MVLHASSHSMTVRSESRRCLRSGLALTVMLALSACGAITQPYVSVRTSDTAKVQPPLPHNPTFAKARVIARATAKGFDDKLQGLEEYDLATGMVFVGAGLAGLAIGLYDAGLDAVYGAGLGGATAVAGRSFLPIQKRKEVYQSGSRAINCAISSISLGVPDNPGQPADPNARSAAAPKTRGQLGASADELRTLASRMKQPIGRRARMLGSVELRGPAELRAMSSELLVESANATDAGIKVSSMIAATRAREAAISTEESRELALELANQIDDAIGTRGERLIYATEAIVGAVNKQIVEAAITPDASLKAAQAHIATVNEAIKDKSESTKDKADEAKNDTDSANEALSLSAGMATGTARIARTSGEAAEVAETEKENVEDIKSQAETVLKIVKVSEQCLQGLN